LKELHEPLESFTRNFLVDVVAAVDPSTNDIVSVFFPHRQNIAVDVLRMAALPPQN
jgi:hypothetical protein